MHSILQIGLAAMLLLGGVAQADQPAAGASVPAGMMLDGAPLQFVENVGQIAEGARFEVRSGSATLFLADDAIWLTRTGADAQGGDTQVNLRVSFPGARARPQIEPFDRLATHVSFFLGSEPRGWHTNVPVWGGVRYRDLYPGIDLELSGARGRLALRMATRPGADLQAVRMRAEGAERQAILGDSIVFNTALGELRLPLIELAGAPNLAPAAHGDTISAPFARGTSAADAPSADAASDLAYSTLFSSNGDDQGDMLAVDSQGAAYIGGFTSSGQFPTSPGAYRVSPPGINGIIVKQAAEPGAAPAYSAVIGGFGPDYISGIAVDSSGAAYLVGYTAARDFPTKSAYDNGGRLVDSTNRDTFITKLNPDGTDLVYSTYLGGNGDERGFEIAIDSAGAAYVTGRTTSSDFPTKGSEFDTSYNGSFDAYVAKLSPSGRQLEYATYLGGSANDQGNDIAVDAGGAAYVTGYTLSSVFPAIGGYDSAPNGLEDVFVVKLDASGSSVVYGTYIGGSDSERGESIALDGTGAAYVVGATLSSNFPATPGAPYTTPSGLNDAFVLKLSPSGQALPYASYLGGADEDFGTGVAVSDSGDVFVSGNTSSLDLPTTNNAYASQPNGLQDGFVARLTAASNSAPSYVTYLGGTALDSIDGIALDRSGAPFVTGFTQSSNYPTTPGASNRTYVDGDDALLTKLALGGVPLYTIAGSVRDSNQNGVGGVTITAGALSTSTQNDGSYSLAGLPAATYTIVPSKPGYTFNPGSITLPISTDQSGLNFAVTIPTYSITGQVIVGTSGAPLAGVTIADGAGGSATTNASGIYTLSGLVAGNYTLTPSRSGYSFVPATRAIALSGNVEGQHFIAEAIVQKAESKAYLPLAYNSIAQERGCDDYEPNDDRKANPSPIDIGTSIRAKICSKEKLTPPNNLREDNYLIQNPAGSPIVATLTLPLKLRGHVYVAIYNKENLNTTVCFNTELKAEVNQIKCAFDQGGANVIRLYTPKGDPTVDDQNEYTLVVQFQN